MSGEKNFSGSTNAEPRLVGVATGGTRKQSGSLVEAAEEEPVGEEA
ncbi:MAG TPA: hypothetical protein VGW36_03940 [Pyrinomonadaceae bacterium]|nr:hypothetical protein [Pyrinomonadaceae bacterium]